MLININSKKNKHAVYRALGFSGLFVLLSQFGAMNICAKPKKDIRKLTSHFNEPGDHDNWSFSNPPGTRVSFTDHPGLTTIHLPKEYEEVKGTLEHPIVLSDYPPGWECEIECVHEFVTGGGASDAAIGLNLVVTFSDPSTWPEDRFKPPPDARSFQIFNVQLGFRGPDKKALIWGQGDLDPSGAANGDWGFPTYDVGDGQHDGGAAKSATYFVARVESPTRVAIGVRFEQFTAFSYRIIDVSQWGRITGVWEIGPIVASTASLKSQWPDTGRTEHTPIHPTRAYFGFCDFRYPHIPDFVPAIEYLSEDFNIPGFIGPWQVEFHGTYYETWSNPGYLTFTMRGIESAPGGGGGNFRFSHYPPPYEIESCFIAPDDTIPWNFLMNFTVYTTDEHYQGANPQGANLNPDGMGTPPWWWVPGVVNVPGKGHLAGNIFGEERNVSGHTPYYDSSPLEWDKKGGLGPRFPDGIPESILSHKPLYMLLRVLEEGDLQMGFRADPGDEWYLSPVWKPPVKIKAFGQHAFGPFNYPGMPDYHQLLIDYWHYREGISGPLWNESNKHFQQ